MRKYFLSALLPVYLLTSGCGSGVNTIVLEPEAGLIIRISDIKFVKSQNRVIGFVEIKQRAFFILRGRQCICIGKNARRMGNRQGIDKCQQSQNSEISGLLASFKL